MSQLQKAIERFLSRKTGKESFEISMKLMGIMRDAEKKRAPYA